STQICSVSRPLSCLAMPLTVLALALVAGCEPREQIRSYEVGRTAEPRSPVDGATLGNQLDHTLVAILPHEGEAWFFKMTASAPVVERHREAFLQFLNTLSPGEPDSRPVAWSVPSSWEEQG